jgi:NAD(P)-dependent dehydrogenase (short-subunit alcohol dehydrogenase family)
MPDFITSYPEKSRKKWIITGGAGFIGCHAAARFHAGGHRVSIVENLSRRWAAENVAWLRGQGITNFVRADESEKGTSLISGTSGTSGTSGCQTWLLVSGEGKGVVTAL